jgi:hypothetical protein
MGLVTYSDFAKAQGVSQPAVSGAAKKRLARAVRIVKGRPMLDEELAAELWGRGNVRQARQPKPANDAPAADERPAAKRQKAAHPAADAVAAEVLKLPDDQIPDLGISLERKEHYRAELAKVEALQKREEVGSIADMRREAFALGKIIREGVLGIIPRISADLAAIGDQFEVERRLEGELLTALRSLADG